jgi:hypothetical protein
MKSPKYIYRYLMIFTLGLCLSACRQSDNQKTLGNSNDTSNVNREGGPPIRDTATINKDRADSARMPASDSMSKGNADPTGHVNKRKQ